MFVFHAVAVSQGFEGKDSSVTMVRTTPKIDGFHVSDDVQYAGVSDDNDGDNNDVLVEFLM